MAFLLTWSRKNFEHEPKSRSKSAPPTLTLAHHLVKSSAPDDLVLSISNPPPPLPFPGIVKQIPDFIFQRTSGMIAVF